MIEDYARFALDDDTILHNLKHLRHDFASATSDLLADAILHRDTPGDVGTTTKTTTELSRDDLAHVVTAAGKRLGEALRTIEEYLKTIDPTRAAQVEPLRYRFYTEEQQLADAPPGRLRFRKGAAVRPDHRGPLHAPLARSRRAGDPRRRGLPPSSAKSPWTAANSSIARQARRTLPGHNVLSIINDRPDIALSPTPTASTSARPISPRRCPQAHRPRQNPRRQHAQPRAGQASRPRRRRLHRRRPDLQSSTKPRDFVPGLDYARQIAAQSSRSPPSRLRGLPWRMSMKCWQPVSKRLRSPRPS